MIPDELIESYMDMLFGRSEPGQEIHHLLLVSADPAHINAFGFPDTDKLHICVYALAPVGADLDGDEFVTTAVAGAISQVVREAGQVIYFAGLAIEVHAVPKDGTEVTENLARRLRADRKLQEHPSAVEVTIFYAAARNGRRWLGEHVLTGPLAGTKVGPTLRTGGLGQDEREAHQRLLRLAVSTDVAAMP